MVESWEDLDKGFVVEKVSTRILNLKALPKIPTLWHYLPQDIFSILVLYLNEHQILKLRLCCKSWKESLMKVPSIWEKFSREKWSEIFTDKYYNLNWCQIYFDSNQQTNKATYTYKTPKDGLWGTVYINITQGPYAWLIEVDRVWGGTAATITIKAVNSKTKNTLQDIYLQVSDETVEVVKISHRFSVAFKHHTHLKTQRFSFYIEFKVRVTNRGEILEDKGIWEDRYQNIKIWFGKLNKQKIPKTSEKLGNAIKDIFRNIYKPGWMSEEESQFYAMIPSIFARRLESDGLITFSAK